MRKEIKFHRTRSRFIINIERHNVIISNFERGFRAILELKKNARDRTLIVSQNPRKIITATSQRSTIKLP